MSEEKTKTNGVTMLVANNHIHVNVDITFFVEKREEYSEVHISDVIGKLVLENLRQEPRAVLTPGQYKASMTLISSAMETTVPEEPKKKPAKKATKKRAVRKTKDK